MYENKSSFKLRAFFVILGLTASILLPGCSSSDTITSGNELAEFEGTWRSGCRETRVVNIPEENQPDGYTQSTLTIDSTSSTYNQNRRRYIDSDCVFQNPDDPISVGQDRGINFVSFVIVETGLVATVVRYLSTGPAPDLIEILYRDGDILYRGSNNGGVILNTIPTRLNLDFPWQLVK